MARGIQVSSSPSELGFQVQPHVVKLSQPSCFKLSNCSTECMGCSLNNTQGGGALLISYAVPAMSLCQNLDLQLSLLEGNLSS